MSNILLKVYGGFLPAPEKMDEEILGLSHLVMGEDSFFERDGNLINISFEGIYFPVDELLEILKGHLLPESEGRLDVMDMEAWTLTRYVWEKNQFEASRPRNLNQVMEYSGF